MRNKQQLTRLLIDRLGLEEQISLDQAMSSWWCNIRETGGMRLTTTGHDTLSKILDIEHYTIEIDQKKFNRRTLLDLDKKLECPYYLVASKGRVTSLILYGSREAVLANLYGDISRFLANYAK